MWQAMAAGAGLGLGKSLLDQQQEKRDREMAAAIAQWSPWTGMQVPMPKRTDYLGNVMQGGLAGASLGQGMDQQAAYQNYMMGGQPSTAQPGYNYMGTTGGFAGGPQKKLY